MHLSERDHSLLTYVSKFAFLTSKHLQYWLFNDCKSTKPYYRCIDRLTAAHYLTALEFKYYPNGKGGNGFSIFKLGPIGQRTYTHRTTPRLEYLPHTIAVADSYDAMLRLERAGKLYIRNYATEPNCWFDVKGSDKLYEVRPDLSVDLTRSHGHSPRYLEIDRDSQSDNDIRRKLRGYVGAIEYADTSRWPETQRVWFIAIHQARVEALARLINELGDDYRPWFHVMTLDGMIAGLSQ
jgi:hypothetical protein